MYIPKKKKAIPVFGRFRNNPPSPFYTGSNHRSESRVEDEQDKPQSDSSALPVYLSPYKSQSFEANRDREEAVLDREIAERKVGDKNSPQKNAGSKYHTLRAGGNAYPACAPVCSLPTWSVSDFVAPNTWSVVRQEQLEETRDINVRLTNKAMQPISNWTLDRWNASRSHLVITFGS
jgi:hypothetical protein